jgi:hypothetical protein
MLRAETVPMLRSVSTIMPPGLVVSSLLFSSLMSSPKKFFISRLVAKPIKGTHARARSAKGHINLNISRGKSMIQT